MSYYNEDQRSAKHPLKRPQGYNFSDQQIEEIKSISIVNLKFCKVEIRSPTGANTYGSQGRITTIFPDGYLTHATRAKNEDNIREAESQGYSGPDAVWKSLVEHEFLHSLISELLYDRPSLVLETESGRKFHPSWLRYQEEAVVIGVQYLVNRKIFEIAASDWNQLDLSTRLLIGKQVDTSIDGFMERVYYKLQDLWSQIEKDSQ